MSSRSSAGRLPACRIIEQMRSHVSRRALMSLRGRSLSGLIVCNGHAKGGAVVRGKPIALTSESSRRASALIDSQHKRGLFRNRSVVVCSERARSVLLKVTFSPDLLVSRLFFVFIGVPCTVRSLAYIVIVAFPFTVRYIAFI
jgi:hypothetical protein